MNKENTAEQTAGINSSLQTEKMYLIKWTARYEYLGKDHYGNDDVELTYSGCQVKGPVTAREAIASIPAHCLERTFGELSRDDEGKSEWEASLREVGIDAEDRVIVLTQEPTSKVNKSGIVSLKQKKGDGRFTYFLAMESELPKLASKWEY